MSSRTASKTLLRVNIGCGRSPTQGWRNFDSSPSIILARTPLLSLAIKQVAGKLFSVETKDFIKFAQINSIEFGNAIKGLPLHDASCEVVYASHVLEHLNARNARSFLAEAYRILAPDGILRLAVPNLQILIDAYNSNGDANSFVSQLNFLPHHDQGKLKSFLRAITGNRTLHQWIYNEASLSATLLDAGFGRPTQLPPGSTTIPDPGALNLRERAWESLYMEAVKPSGPNRNTSSLPGEGAWDG